MNTPPPDDNDSSALNEALRAVREAEEAGQRAVEAVEEANLQLRTADLAIGRALADSERQP